MTDLTTRQHICHCEVCTTSRALEAVKELPWLPEHREKLDTLDGALNAFLEKAANDEMEYDWNLRRISKLFGIELAEPDLIIAKIKELQAQVQQEAPAPVSN